jgi:hypothetical protein
VQHVDAVGEPKLELDYQGTATDPRGYVFAQIVDEQRHVVLGNQVTPIADQARRPAALGLALAGGRRRRDRARARTTRCRSRAARASTAVCARRAPSR